MTDRDRLVTEKYGGDATAPGVTQDLARLNAGEPLAYVIGHIPFLGLSIGLASRPLIPRPETEWWTEELCTRIGDHPRTVLDVCAGSGAIGLAVLSHCPQARVSFGELIREHAEQIRMTVDSNHLDATRADIRAGDLFAPFAGERFDIITANPPYIPEHRVLSESVSAYEPHEALFAGTDGLLVIQRILGEALSHLRPGGELWMECDISNISEAARRAREAGFTHADIRTDQYGRPRLLVAY